MNSIDSMNSMMSKAQKFLFINCICRLYAAVIFVAVWCNGKSHPSELKRHLTWTIRDIYGVVNINNIALNLHRGQASGNWSFAVLLWICYYSIYSVCILINNDFVFYSAVCFKVEMNRLSEVFWMGIHFLLCRFRYMIDGQGGRPTYVCPGYFELV